MSKRLWATLAAFVAFTLLGRIVFRLPLPSDGIELYVTVSFSIITGTIAVWKALAEEQG